MAKILVVEDNDGLQPVHRDLHLEPPARQVARQHVTIHVARPAGSGMDLSAAERDCIDGRARSVIAKGSVATWRVLPIPTSFCWNEPSRGSTAGRQTRSAGIRRGRTFRW
jgi:hypothetical protein